MIEVYWRQSSKINHDLYIWDGKNLKCCVNHDCPEWVDSAYGNDFEKVTNLKYGKTLFKFIE